MRPVHYRIRLWSCIHSASLIGEYRVGSYIIYLSALAAHNYAVSLQAHTWISINLFIPFQGGLSVSSPCRAGSHTRTHNARPSLT